MSENTETSVLECTSDDVLKENFSKLLTDDHSTTVIDNRSFIFGSDLSSLTEENAELEVVVQDSTLNIPEPRINLTNFEEASRSQQAVIDNQNLRKDYNNLMKSHTHLHELYTKLLDVHINCFLKFYDASVEHDILQKTCEEYETEILYHDKDITHIQELAEKDYEKLKKSLIHKQQEIENLKKDAELNMEKIMQQSNDLNHLKRLCDNVHCRETDNLQTLDNLRHLVQTMRNEIEERDAQIVEMKKEEARRCLKKKKQKRTSITFQDAIINTNLTKESDKDETDPSKNKVSASESEEGEVSGDQGNAETAEVSKLKASDIQQKTLLSDSDMSESDVSDSEASNPETYLAYLNDELRAIKRIERCFERKEKKMSKSVKFLNGKLENTLCYVKVLENVIDDAHKEISSLKEKLKTQQLETNKKLQHIDELKSELLSTRNEVRNQNARMQRANALLKVHAGRVLELESDVRQHKIINEKIVRSEELMRIKFYKGKIAYDELLNKYGQMELKYSSNVKALKMKESECAHLRYEVKRCSTQRDFLERQRLSITQQKLKCEQERDKIRSMYSEMEITIMEFKSKSSEERAMVEMMKKEKKTLLKVAGRARKLMTEYKQLVKIKEYARQLLKNENASLKGRVSKMELDVAKAEKERDRAIEETRTLNLQIDYLVNENKHRKNVLEVYRKRIVDLRSKLKESNVAYEDVRSAKRKSDVILAGVVAENTDIKKLLKISLHQVRQHKEDIVCRDKIIAKTENSLFKANCKINELQVRVDTEVGTSQKLRTEIKELNESIKTLTRSIRDQESNIKVLEQDISRTTIEKTEVATLAARRITEIKILRRKIDILQNILMNAGLEYDNRLKDISILKIDLQRVKEENNALIINFDTANNIKGELIKKERDFQIETMKKVHLENEFHSPVFIHRRRIENADDISKLRQKIEHLQKRLQAEYSKTIQYKGKLTEMEGVIHSLKKTISQQKGAESRNEAAKFRTLLDQRNKKIKCLEAEVTMRETQICKLKKELKNIAEQKCCSSCGKK